MSSSNGSQTQLYTVGFIAGILLAFGCFTAAAIYLFSFLHQSSHSLEQLLDAEGSAYSISVAINVQTVMNKMALLSCGVFSGMAFGFLGFALFLIGVRGNVELEAESRSSRMRVARLAPGLFVIICASVIISLSVTQRFQLEYVGGGPSSAAFGSPDVPRGSGAADFDPKSILDSNLGVEDGAREAGEADEWGARNE